MEKGLLKKLLDEGLSLAEIARRHGLDSSTVGKMAKRWALEPAGRSKYAPAKIDIDELRRLLAAEASERSLAEHFGVSPTTVRKHLARNGLTTVHADGLRRHRLSQGPTARQREMSCRRHGRTLFQLQGRGSYRCLVCRAEAVARRRRKVKRILVEEAGGACIICGYSRCVRALHFHHREPEAKSFALSGRGYTRGIDTLRVEASKCALLCSNCHAEVEGGITRLPN